MSGSFVKFQVSRELLHQLLQMPTDAIITGVEAGESPLWFWVHAHDPSITTGGTHSDPATVIPYVKQEATEWHWNAPKEML